MSNKKTYDKKNVADYYAKEDRLQLPEKAILESLKQRFPRMKMLDIGVGGGRTTRHFAEIAAEYIGVDYSEEMIAACHRRFAGGSDTMTFAVCDARDLRMFEENCFDFILFSFNGIDYVSYEDRDRVFREVQRVGKAGGWFAFSTHNLRGASGIFKFQGLRGRSLSRVGKNTVKWLLVNFLCNKPAVRRDLMHKPYAFINDGEHAFHLKTCYTQPDEQLERLQEWFDNIRVFSVLTGKEIDDNSEMKGIEDPWLYYLCTVR